MDKNKIYFASDFHLGSPSIDESRKRERIIIRWLNSIEKDAKKIYLLGDIFDFWFEYKKVIPKGFVRLLGKLAELSDNGIEIHLFAGNHDLWIKDYLKYEIGININHKCLLIKECGLDILVGHGDGLGKGDYSYKILKRIFTSKVCQWAFARIHPNLAFSLAHLWSNKSRKNEGKNNFSTKEKEIIYGYCKSQQSISPIDYYIFGHRHLPLEIKIDKKSTYINTGDWIEHYTYAVLENKKVQLKSFKV